MAEADEVAASGRRSKSTLGVSLGVDDDVPQDHRVRVAVRVRPFNKADHGDQSVCLSVDGPKITADNGQKAQSFTYDFVFTKDQREVYDCLGEGLLHDAFSGYNATIFAYGQTGSGKTYSMVGVEDNREHEGLLPRICKEMFELGEQLMAGDNTLIIKTQVSFVEVYNEKIHDLLEFEGTGHQAATSEELRELKLKEDKKTKGFYVDQLSLHTVSNYARVKHLISVGTELRTKAGTNMNELSSRSHSVFTIYLNQTHDPPNPMHRDMSSKLTIVDLAGSERQSKTDVEDAKRLKEAERINMSLLILGRCLSACAEGSKGHIPIRESVLTKMLMDIFGGNAKTWMFAAVSPSSFNFAETMSTLQYAHNAKKIKNKAKVNTLGKALEIKELKEQIKALGKTLVEELEKAAQQKELLDAEILAIHQEKDLLSSSLKAIQEDNEELKAMLEKALAENEELRAMLAAGGPKRQAAPVEDDSGEEEEESEEEAADGTTKKKRTKRNISLAPGKHLLGTAIGDYAIDLDDDEEWAHMSKEEKLARIHAELSAKLHLANPELSVRGSGRRTNRGELTGRRFLPQNNDIRTYVGHAAAVYCCAFSPTGEKMVSASRDRTLKVWDVKSGSELFSLRGHKGFVLSCAYSPNDVNIVSASDDKAVKIWEATTGRKVLTLRGHNDKVYGVSYSPSGAEVASASCDKTIRIWNATNGNKIITLRKHTGAVFCAKFSPDGQRLVSASDDRTVRIWDWAQGNELQELKGHTGTVWSCCFHPSLGYVLSSSMDGSIKLWDTATGEATKSYVGHSAPVHCVIFAKDGARIVSASRDHTLKVWDTETKEDLHTLIGHTNTIYCCAVYNNLILSCSSDGNLKVFNLKV